LCLIYFENRLCEGDFTTTAWPKLLQLAISYGWEPTRLWFDLQTEQLDILSPYSLETSPTRNYFPPTPTSVIVSAEEALRLARALERALPDLPDHDAKAHLRNITGGGINQHQEEKLTPLEWFSGTNKTRLKEFIDLCRAEGFTLS
jgi:hypothetical protein